MNTNDTNVIYQQVGGVMNVSATHSFGVLVSVAIISVIVGYLLALFPYPRHRVPGDRLANFIRFIKLEPVFFDGGLLAAIAFWSAVQYGFSSEEAYKYVNAYVIFWIKTGTNCIVSPLVALKAFRSRSYGDYQDDKAAKNGLTKQVTDSESTVTTRTQQTNPPEAAPAQTQETTQP